ncbi:1-acyl-sn-glycerol-3-phosphate acyltransferase [bacterium]|nr:1-acyl-sn-glycerol-3-phosphate acyltransferase [bacterium]
MIFRSILGAAGAWSVFVGYLLAFDPQLRWAYAFSGSIDDTMARFGKCLSRSIRAGLCSLQVKGRENLPEHGGYIVVGNHQSLVESFVPLYELRALHPRYIAKKELGRWLPAISFALRSGGHCLIDRKDHEGALQKISALGRQVAEGEVSAIIFPEGTRSLEGDLQHFKKGGLLALLGSAPQADVLPMVVHNGHKIFPKGLPRVEAGAKVTLSFLPVLKRSDFADNEALIETLHNLMAKTHADLEAADSRR